MHCEWKTKEILNWTAQQFSNMQSMQWYIASTMWNPHIVKLGLAPNSGEVVFLQIYISCLLLPLSVCLATCWSIASRKFPSHDDVKRWCGCRRWCVNLQSCKMKSTDTILNRTNSTDYLKEPKKWIWNYEMNQIFIGHQHEQYNWVIHENRLAYVCPWITTATINHYIDSNLEFCELTMARPLFQKCHKMIW